MAALKDFPYTVIYPDACTTLIPPLSPHIYRYNLYFQSNYTRYEVTWAVSVTLELTLHTYHCYQHKRNTFPVKKPISQCAPLTEKRDNFRRAFKGPFRICPGLN